MKTEGKTAYVLKQGDAKFAEAVPVEIWCAFASTKAYKVTLTIQRDQCEDSDTTIVNLKAGPWLNIPNPLFQCMDGPSGTATVPFNIFGTEDVDYRLSTDNSLCAMVYGKQRQKYQTLQSHLLHRISEPSNDAIQIPTTMIYRCTIYSMHGSCQ